MTKFDLPTRRQRQLERAADRLLAKSGFFARPEKDDAEYIPVDPDAITCSGLRNPCVGRP